MRYHIVSDNLYFLTGSEDYLTGRGCLHLYITAVSSLRWSWCVISMVIWNLVMCWFVHSMILFLGRMYWSYHAYCLGEYYLCLFYSIWKTTGSLPRVLNSTVTEDAFFILLKKMETATYSRRNITDKHMETIGFLTSGKTINELVMATGWTAKNSITSERHCWRGAVLPEPRIMKFFSAETYWPY